MNAEITQKNFTAVTIEDSPVVADRLECIFSDMDFVHYAGNATNIDDSLVLIQEFRPMVAIVDIQLKEDAPQRTGIDLLVLLRELYPEMNIIIFTNISSSQYRHKCMTLGANYFLDKSNDFGKIPEILKQIHHQTILNAS